MKIARHNLRQAARRCSSARNYGVDSLERAIGKHVASRFIDSLNENSNIIVSQFLIRSFYPMFLISLTPLLIAVQDTPTTMVSDPSNLSSWEWNAGLEWRVEI